MSKGKYYCLKISFKQIRWCRIVQFSATYSHMKNVVKMEKFSRCDNYLKGMKETLEYLKIKLEAEIDKFR